MKRPELFERIKDIIYAKLGIEDDIKEDQHLFNDLGFDSLDVVELMMKCEKFFNITIEDAEIDKITTIKEVLDYLEFKTN